MTSTPGIVRPARRPPGWTAPGPRPGRERVELGPRPGEDLCFLAGDWRILQRLGGHRWSLDDLVTAWVAVDEHGAEPPAVAVDLGCGIGTVALLLAWHWPALRVVGIEAQAASIELARRSVAWNGVEGRCAMRHADFRDPGARAGLEQVALVTGTPPYLPPAAATTSPESQRAHCRMELAGGVEDYVAAAAAMLVPGGRFVVCAAARQRARVARAADAGALRSTRRLTVVPRAGKPPLFDVHVLVRRAESGPGTDETLVVRDGYGRRTAAFVAIRSAFGMPP